MRKVVAILLILSFLGGGVARLVLAFQPQVTRASEAALGKTGLLILGFLNIVVSTVGMICLLLEIFGPWTILFALMITSLVEVIVRVRSGAKFL